MLVSSTKMRCAAGIAKHLQVFELRYGDSESFRYAPEPRILRFFRNPGNLFEKISAERIVFSSGIASWWLFCHRGTLSRAFHEAFPGGAGGVALLDLLTSVWGEHERLEPSGRHKAMLEERSRVILG